LNKLLTLAFVFALTSIGAEASVSTGKASYYRAKNVITCAHRSLPFGTRVRVTNLSNQKSMVLVVADRGPYVKGRIIDVSKTAAVTLGFREAGIIKVSVETVTN